MENINFNYEIVSGAIACLVILIPLLLWFATQDESAYVQGAKRLALLASTLLAGFVILAEIAFFNFGNPRLASYGIVPALLLVFSILLLGTPRFYRIFGGLGRLGQSNGCQTSVVIDEDMQRVQSEMWQRLRQLPHFRETLAGNELISLVTGDRVFWLENQNPPCIAIEFASRTTISVARIEALSAYLDVQGGIAKHLGGRSSRFRRLNNE